MVINKTLNKKIFINYILNFDSLNNKYYFNQFLSICVLFVSLFFCTVQHIVICFSFLSLLLYIDSNLILYIICIDHLFFIIFCFSLIFHLIQILFLNFTINIQINIYVFLLKNKNNMMAQERIKTLHNFCLYILNKLKCMSCFLCKFILQKNFSNRLLINYFNLMIYIFIYISSSLLLAFVLSIFMIQIGNENNYNHMFVNR